MPTSELVSALSRFTTTTQKEQKELSGWHIRKAYSVYLVDTTRLFDSVSDIYSQTPYSCDLLLCD